MSKINELKQKRAAKIKEARSILDVADSEKRALTAEEQNKYDVIFKDINDLGDTIKLEEQQIELERSIADEASRQASQAARQNGTKTETKTADTIAQAVRSFLVNGEVTPEFRALQVDSDTSGGYLVMTEQFVNTLLKAVDDAVFIRTLGTTFRVPTATSLGAPSLDNDPDDADWTVELGTGSEDASMSFGKRNLHPHPLAKRLKISETLLRKGMMVSADGSMMGPEQLVQARLAYKFGVTEEKAFLTGNGSEQPLGLFTASSYGITTARDVSTDNTTTAMTFDGLLNVFYNQKGQYQRTSSWLFHRDGIKQIAKLKDANDHYLWQASVVQGEPDVIKGRPVYSSEFAPNTFTTGLYVGLFGDFSYYWIADALDIRIKRLGELYAESDLIGFIGRKETDGMPVLEEAFTRITLA